MSIGTNFELHIIKKKEKEKHGQIIFSFNFHIWCCLTEIFGIMLNFHIFSAVKLLKLHENESKN